MDEASKTLRIYPELLNMYLKEPILDIGPGRDKITESAVGFDIAQGNAEVIDEYFKQKFRTVFSSHCLEHMSKPIDALQRWGKLVDEGGHLIVIIPDEDLYEQGHFPSIFNSDHKATFTLSKSNSWSPVSVNVLEMADSLPGFSIVYCALQDDGYRRDLQSFGLVRFETKWGLTSKTLALFGNLGASHLQRIFMKRFSIDQTLDSKVLAQITLILRKN
jgi:hypothetical protein